MAQKFTVPLTVKQLSSSGSDAITIFVDADTFARLKIEAGGRLTWGSGSGAGDVNLYRDGADVLKTDDKFVAGKELVSAHSSGDEGGEIQLAIPQTNTTISSGVAIDVYQNKLRIYETGGSNRGAYIDLTAASNGVASNLLAGGGGGATNLDGLTDVTITSASTGQVLKYNGTAWVNDTDSTGTTISSIDDINDVVITSAEEFQSLVYDGTNWVNKHAPVVTYVRNAESTTLTTGTAVYLFGATGDHASVKRADNDSDTTSSKVVGLVGANIAASQNGPVVTRGYVDGIDLSVGYSAGDILWLGEDGGFTTTKPSAPEHLVFIGVVVRATNNGIVYVATQNGYELEELHDVDINTSTLASGDFLKYNGTLWVNDPINLGTDTVGNYVSDVTAGTGVTVTHTPAEGSSPTIAIGQAVASSDTPTFAGLNLNGAIVFEGATADNFETTLTVTDPTADRTITLPNVNGTVVTTGDTGTITSTMIADGTIVNADISTSAAIAHSKLANATPGQVLLGTTTSGVVTATTISGDITINGAGVATIAANSVALGTDTTGDYVASLVAGNGITLSNNSGEGATPTINSGATVSDSTPSSPTTGQLWYESDTGATFVYTGSAWVEVGATQGPYVCTSTTRPSSPYEGQLIYETDTDRILVYNSSAWVMMVAAGAPPGLQLIKTQTFTAQSTQQFTSIFTSDYANYRCSLDLTASTGTNFYIRFLVGTTVQTGNILSTNLYNQLSAGSLSKNTRSDQYGLIGAAFATYTSNYIIEWMNPQVADYTSYYANGVGGRSNTDSDFNQTFARNIATTQIDGFEITTAGAPTLTGTLRVYGYRNSI